MIKPLLALQAEEFASVGRALHQDSSDLIAKQDCAWDAQTKSCGLSLSAIGSFYNELPQELLDLAYSVQVCWSFPV